MLTFITNYFQTHKLISHALQHLIYKLKKAACIGDFKNPK